MGQVTEISWCDSTFNPWIGCTKVSAGCTNCYAEALMDKRWGKVKWGPNGTRQRTSAANWREPLKWDAAANAAGERRRVFCASLADVFEDRPELVPWRRELFEMVCRTPSLDWLMLTKRPENALRMMVEAGLYAVENPSLPCPQPNLWIGTSVENQETADERIPHLLKTPAAVRFLSCEPLLSEIDLKNIGPEKWDVTCGWKARADNERGWANTPRVDWIIVGGESGPGARPCNVEWVRSIVKQCAAADLPCFVKQLGAKPVTDRTSSGTCRGKVPVEWYPSMKLSDVKGGDPSEWPADLRVRQFPNATEVSHA